MLYGISMWMIFGNIIGALAMVALVTFVIVRLTLHAMPSDDVTLQPDQRLYVAGDMSINQFDAMHHALLVTGFHAPPATPEHRY